jgi:K(+)-stimulated pyrophosphate-energized sodium pump
MTIMELVYVPIAGAFLAILYAVLTALRILRKSPGTLRMRELSDTIYHGAMTFLNQEYRVMLIYVVIVAAVLAFINSLTAAAFVIGALCSAIAGNVGMRVATKANTRTAEAVKHSIGAGLRLAFSSGLVMGLAVVGLGLLGISALYLLWNDVKILVGFGFGASSIALFARVGGGIYTKSADMGADLVGKVEAKIPEDDPRNPAVIADNVGDNVGDVAGMGADLFESYVGSIIAAMMLGALLESGMAWVLLPTIFATWGILSSIIGSLAVRTGAEADIGALHGALNRGVFGAALLSAVGGAWISNQMVGTLDPFYAFLAGLIAGIVIGLSAEYYTENRFGPTRNIATAAQTGPATNVLEGFSVGMMSTAVPIVAISAATLIAYYSYGLYGIAIAGVGMLSTLGITLAIDCYGPVADNAAGIAEMAALGPKVRKRAERLDAVGNTTAAIGKGFAIGSAALTALALFSAYVQALGEKGIALSLQLTDPKVVVGLFVGAMLPFVFCSLTMRAVRKGASLIVEEVRRQFRSIKGLMAGKAKPDYNTCIAISTRAALRNMAAPAAIAILTPLVVGILPGVLGFDSIAGLEIVAGLLAGAIVSGLMLAITLANAGGAWDNAKKYIEEGRLGGKGSEAHAAAVIGDTIGDPFKDTSGPSLNILIKLMSMASLLFLPLLV